MKEKLAKNNVCLANLVLCYRKIVPVGLCKWWLSVSLLPRKTVSERLHNYQLLEDTIHDATKSTLGSGNQMPSSCTHKTDSSAFLSHGSSGGVGGRTMRVQSFLSSLLSSLTTALFKLEHPTQFYIDLPYAVISFPKDCITKLKKPMQKYNYTNVNILTVVMVPVAEDSQSHMRARKETERKIQWCLVVRNTRYIFKFYNVHNYENKATD